MTMPREMTPAVRQCGRGSNRQSASNAEAASSPEFSDSVVVIGYDCCVYVITVDDVAVTIVVDVAAVGCHHCC